MPEGSSAYWMVPKEQVSLVSILRSLGYEIVSSGEITKAGVLLGKHRNVAPEVILEQPASVAQLEEMLKLQVFLDAQSVVYSRPQYSAEFAKQLYASLQQQRAGIDKLLAQLEKVVPEVAQGPPTGSAIDSSAPRPPNPSVYGQPISTLKITPAMRMRLQGFGTITIGDIVDKTADELCHRMRYFGNPQINCLRKALAVHGVYLKGEGPAPAPDPQPTSGQPQSTEALVYRRKLSDLGVPAEYRAPLLEKGLVTVGDVVQYPEKYLTSIIGRAGFTALIELLEKQAILEVGKRLSLTVYTPRTDVSGQSVYALDLKKLDDKWKARVYGTFVRNGIDTLEDIASKTPAELKAIGIGRKNIERVKRGLAEKGLWLAGQAIPTVEVPSPADQSEEFVDAAS